MKEWELIGPPGSFAEGVFKGFQRLNSEEVAEKVVSLQNPQIRRSQRVQEKLLELEKHGVQPTEEDIFKLYEEKVLMEMHNTKALSSNTFVFVRFTSRRAARTQTRSSRTRATPSDTTSATTSRTVPTETNQFLSLWTICPEVTFSSTVLLTSLGAGFFLRLKRLRSRLKRVCMRRRVNIPPSLQPLILRN
jgi:hypothetical protein